MNTNPPNNDQVRINIESFIKTALIFLVLYACFLVFKPFLMPVVWAIIFAVVLYPLHLKLMKLLRGRSNLSATFITILVLAVLIVPTFFFTEILIESVQEFAEQLKDDTFKVPPPPDSVGDWPVVGKSVEKTWLFFSNNLSAAIDSFRPQIIKIGEWLLSTVSGIAMGAVVIFLSIIIAGIFLANSTNSYQFAVNIFTKIVGENGRKMVDNSKMTIKSVVNGVLGTALIQSTLISVGFFVAGVPGAPILSIVVFFFAVIQIPAILVVLPVVIYMFTILSGFGATLFAVWCLLGSISDNFFKPLLLGRGMEIPMLVILIGSIGGMMLLGITGLFIGAVILALGYQLFQMWADFDSNSQR